MRRLLLGESALTDHAHLPPRDAAQLWRATPGARVAFTPDGLAGLSREIRQTVHLVESADGALGLAIGGALTPAGEGYRWRGTAPPVYPEWLGDRRFLIAHGVRFPYVAGAMANGIATPALVVAMARAGMLGFFGAGGLSLARVEAGLGEIMGALSPEAPFGANLIHSPHEPALEAAVADLYIARGVRRVSASAYMKLTLPIVRYACAGLRQAPDGRPVRRNHVFAKISRVEVARAFMQPPPAEMLDALVARGELSATEATIARRLPLAEDITVEADSGGHTDNRALTALLPDIAHLRAALVAKQAISRPIRLGAAGGLGTPRAIAAAFALGADYVLTGSVNQSAVESGLSAQGRALLARADSTDVTMAPSPDMFELGVQVQVLKRGTLFAQRAQRLYATYRAYDGIESIPTAERDMLERKVLGASLDAIWAETEAFWRRRQPAELERAARDPKHRMALCFRWYVGKSSRWAIAGAPERALDYQIWCGPAMGAFNRWAAGSHLADPEQRGVVDIALNLLEGAAMITRAQQLRAMGVPLPSSAFDYRPRPLR